MIGGGFRGNFPRKPGSKDKGSTLGPTQGPPAHNLKGFVENGPRVSPPSLSPSNASPKVHGRGVVEAGPPAHNLKGFVENGPRVTPPSLSPSNASSKVHGKGFLETGPKVQPVKKEGDQQGVGQAPVNWTKKPDVKRTIDVIWNGVIHGVSGYAKANREIIKRLAPCLNLRFSPSMLFNASLADDEAKELWRIHKREKILFDVPMVSFTLPRVEKKSAHRVIYTMMETETVHPNMVQVMNENYEECWTPTYWNAKTFRRGGLTLPIKVMPLGIDPSIYVPDLPGRMPEATLLTTRDMGKTAAPLGFVFVYVCQPTFRKGVDFLVSCFEAAFRDNPKVHLLLGTTAYSLESAKYLPNNKLKSNIWGLSGRLTEKGLASMYRACHAYVCTSRGEGANLPLMEAGASGLPIIAPYSSVHPEIMPPGYGYFFETDGYNAIAESKKVSRWFEGMLFSDYGSTARRSLIQQMNAVVKNYEEARTVGIRYSTYIRSKYTWHATARLIHDRVRELL